MVKHSRRTFFDEIRRMWEQMDEMMSSLWDETGVGIPEFEEEKLGVRTPDVDIIETGDELVITCDMPGLNKEDIDLKVTEDMIEISSEVKSEDRKEEEGYLRRERSYRKFYRKIPLPKPVIPSKAKAAYNNGVLEVRLKKKEETKSIRINVE
ncbi:MAG: Hsp20/alpha crystallin family protein [Candidatus Odinarchaeia archaeon]